MADFDLTQTDQQVQNILNDAQGAMGASAQTTLTTEYVMLKDTSGIYHKILKSSFTEAIRDVLAGLLVNNDKGTTISQIAAIASGDFGSITPANLASVLGGIWHVKTYDSITTFSSPLQIELGSGFLFACTRGSMNAIFCSVDYWSTNITTIAQTNSFTTNIGTFSKEANSRNITFTPNGSKSLILFFIGEVSLT